LPKKAKTVANNGNTSLPILGTSKDTYSKNTLSKDNYSPNSVEFELSIRLLNHILSRNPKYKKPNLQQWSVHIDRMIRIDKRDPGEIAAVIDWSQDNNFWQTNILSTYKLREKFDQLWMKMQKTEVSKTEQSRFDWMTKAKMK
jgi:hypothetical protein